MLAVTGAFDEDHTVSGSSPPKDEGTLKKWLKSLADLLKRLAGKAVEALLVTVGSGFGVTLSFLSKIVGFVDKHTLALIAFATGIIGGMVNAKSKKVGIIQD